MITNRFIQLFGGHQSWKLSKGNMGYASLGGACLFHFGQQLQIQ